MAQIGIMLEGQFGLTWERWQRILQLAEDVGYQCVFRSDHYTIGQPDQESLETWISLTYAASHTQRIEFGPLVAPVTFRQPAMVARMAAGIDDLSGGRLVYGMGTGWNDYEHKKFGVPFYDIPTRFDMLEDALEVTTRLFNGNDPVNYSGKHFSLDDAILLPRPKRAGGPPILIGGNGPKKTLPLVAKYANEWNAVFCPLDVYKERTQRLNELLDERGRGASAVKRSLMTQVMFGKDDAEVAQKVNTRGQSVEELVARSMFVGRGSAIVDQIGAYIDAGVERFMLQWLDLDDLAGMEQMAQEILPQLQG